MQVSQAEYQILLARTAPKSKAAHLGTDDERKLHDDIAAECKRRGWLAFHGSMAHRTKRTVGEPDFVILANGGRLYLVEAKTRTGKLRTEQLAVAAWCRKLGHTFHIVRSIEEFKDIIYENTK